MAKISDRVERWKAPQPMRVAFASELAVVHHKIRPRVPGCGPCTADAHELYAVVAGGMEVLIDGVWHPAPPRSVSLFRKNSIFGTRGTLPQGRNEVLSILFSTRDESRLAFPARPVLLNLHWWRLLLKFDSECAFDSQGQRVIGCERVIQFIENLSRSLGLAGVEAGMAPHSERRRDTESEWMELWAQAEQLIHEHATHGISADELASRLNVSAATLRRVFIAACGRPPREVLIASRIAEAKRLLASGNLSISEIARRTGYSTIQSFSAAFSRVVGVSPTDFTKTK